MKVARVCAAVLLLTTLTAGSAPVVVQGAQGKPTVSLPPSPKGSAAIQVGGSWSGAGDDRRYNGGSWIAIDYSRPILRGRPNIFGAGASYGTDVKAGTEVWRAGANDSTRLTTQVPLAFGSTTIQPGVYNVLVDLKEGAWTFILSTQPIQPKYDPNDKVLLYGAYNYDKKFDVLRVPMRLSSSPVTVEQFTIAFVDVAGDRASLAMSWDKTVATVDFRLK